MSETMTYTALVALLEAIFVAAGTDADVAGVLARNCAGCERDGSESHGVFRMAGYVASLRSGWVDGRAVPVVEDAAASFVRVNARNGFAQPALAAGRPLAVAKARATGAAVLAIRDSHHFSALWPDVEPFAEEGLVALSFVNSFAVSVPHGGRTPVFGTNPLAFAAPVADAPPLVFDMATSAMAHGDVMLAAREGRSVPPGTGLDRDGMPATDPAAILDGGALVPFGGHKGSLVSMMVELLCAALTGGHFSTEFDWSGHPGAQTPHTGQLVLLIDPAFGGTPAFPLRAADLVRSMRAAGVDRLPGERRRAHRTRADREGIRLDAATLDHLRALLPE
ncbi:MAG: Ldh family oxidoreductase [Amaricoccus sp.]